MKLTYKNPPAPHTIRMNVKGALLAGVCDFGEPVLIANGTLPSQTSLIVSEEIIRKRLVDMKHRQTTRGACHTG